MHTKKRIRFCVKKAEKKYSRCSQFIDHNNRSAWLISLVSPNRTIKHELRRKQGANKHSKFQIKLTFWRRQSIVLNHLKMILFGCYCQYDCWQSNTQYFFFSCFRDHLISFEHFFFRKNNRRFFFGNRICVWHIKNVDVIYDIFVSDSMAMANTPKWDQHRIQSIH